MSSKETAKKTGKFKYETIEAISWLGCTVGLLVISAFGSPIKDFRYELLRPQGLDNVSTASFEQGKINAQLQALYWLDSEARGQGVAVVPKYKALKATLEKKYGPNDHRVALINLKIASTYVNNGMERNAEKYWRPTIQNLGPISHKTPSQFCQTLYELAYANDQFANNPVNTKFLYQKVLELGTEAEKLSPKIAGPSTTVSNITQGIAEQNLLLGETAEANKNFQTALTIGLPYRVAGANIYRRMKIAETYNDMGEPAKALPFAKESVADSRGRYRSDNVKQIQPLLELGRAYYGVGDYKNAIATLKTSLQVSRHLDSSYYSGCQAPQAICNYYLAQCAMKTNAPNKKQAMDSALASLSLGISLYQKELNDGHDIDSDTRNWLMREQKRMSRVLQSHNKSVASLAKKERSQK